GFQTETIEVELTAPVQGLTFNLEAAASIDTTLRLSDILSQEQLPGADQLPPEVLKMQVGFHVVNESFGSFFIAFFEEHLPGLHAAILDRAHSKWKYALLPVELGGNTFELWERTPQYIYLYSHINPTQGNFYILSTDLKLRGDLFAES